MTTFDYAYRRYPTAILTRNECASSALEATLPHSLFLQLIPVDRPTQSSFDSSTLCIHSIEQFKQYFIYMGSYASESRLHSFYGRVLQIPLSEYGRAVRVRACCRSAGVLSEYGRAF